MGLIFITLLVVLAAICDAIMDTLWHHYGDSVFKNLNLQFWNPKISWKNKYIDNNPNKGRKKWKILGFEFNKPVQISDGWHIFKTIKIILLISVITLAYFVIPLETSLNIIVKFVILLTGLGVIRNSVFSLFYERLLVNK